MKSVLKLACGFILATSASKFSMFLCIISGAIGVLSLMIVLSVSNGFEDYFARQFLSYQGHAFVQGGKDLRDDLATSELVREAISVVEGTVVLRSMHNELSVRLRGVDHVPAMFRENLEIDSNLVGGVLTSAGIDTAATDAAAGKDTAVGKDTAATGSTGRDDDSTIEKNRLQQDRLNRDVPEIVNKLGLVLGQGAARRLGVKSGDILRVLFYNRTTGMSEVIWPVLGVFSTGMSMYDYGIAIAGIDRVTKRFEVSPGYLQVFLHDPYQSGAFKKLVHSKYPDHTVEVWQDLDKSILRDLRVQRYALSMIVMCIVLVASFAVCGSCVLLLHQRSRDIALLRSFGMGGASIALIFLLISHMMGIASLALGTLMGGLTLQYLNDVFVMFVDGVNIPILFLPMDLLYISGLMMVLSMLAGLYPARLAVLVSPVRVLRNN